MQRVLVFVEQIFVMEPYKLCDIRISLVELTDIVTHHEAVILRQLHVSCHNRLEHTRQSTERSCILSFAHLLCHELIKGIHIFIVVEHKVADLVSQIVDTVQIGAALKGSNLVVRQESTLDVILGIFKVQNEGAVLATGGSVQAGESLDGGHIPELLIHIHGMEERLIKAGLVLVGNNKDIILVAVERLT